MIEDLVELCEHELEVVGGASEADPQRLADLFVRKALLYWNTPEAGVDVVTALRQSRGHPLSWQLLLSWAITHGDRGLLELSHEAATEALAGAMLISALRDVGETWLYRFSDFERAAGVLQTALELYRAEAGDGARAKAGDDAAVVDRAIADELLYLYRVALAHAGEWRKLGNSLAGAAVASGDPATVAEALHVFCDRLDDHAAARALLERVGGRLTGPGKTDHDRVHRYRVLLITLQLAATGGDGGQGDRDAGPPGATDGDAPRFDEAQLYRRQLALLDASGGGEQEAAAIRLLLVELLRGRGELSSAAEILAGLTAPQHAAAAGFGPRAVSLIEVQLAAAAGDWPRQLAALRRLARGGAGALSEAYAVRAAEVADARGEDPAPALEGWRSTAGAAPDQTTRAIERVLADAPPAAIIEHLESAAAATAAGNWRKPRFLRRAAAVAESRAKDLDAAIALQTLATESADDMVEYRPLMRLYWRKGDRDALAEVYRILIGRAQDTRVSSALLCALGTLQLEAGEPGEAEKAFAAAARQAPRDPVARAAIAGIYRLSERPRELMQVLVELSERLEHQQQLGDVLRELGLIQTALQGDLKEARNTLQRALAIEPNDATTLHALAKLHDRAREWPAAVELRQRALAVPQESRSSRFDIEVIDRAALYMEIGELEEKRRRDDDAALRAYEAALAENGNLVEPLRAQARIYRRLRQLDKVLALLTTERDLDLPDDRKLQVMLDLASLHRDDKAGSRDVEAALDAYLEALRIDPENVTALTGVRTIGRTEGRWDVIAAAYRGAPKTADNLAVLAEALQHTEDWAEYARARGEQMELAAEPSERGKVAHELAEIYHRKLGQIGQAIAAYKEAIAGGVAVAESQRELDRLLAEHERWPELEKAYEEELAAIDQDDTADQLRVLMRLGTLRKEQLGKSAEAIVAFESLLERAPQYVPALEALEELYAQIGREEELLRTLDTRAQVTEDLGERSELLSRIAETRLRRGEITESIDAYRRAFEAQPGNRAVFTAMEKVCYKQQRWEEAMWLYGSAIELVEGAKLRAYRLSDLYARRGQVELNYLDRIDDATRSYLRVLELDPASDTALKFLESIYSRKGDWAALIAAYEKRAELVDTPVKKIQVLRRAARIAQNKLSDAGEASRLYELLLAIDSSDDEALAALEGHHGEHENWDRLVNVLQHRLEVTPAGETATKLLSRIAKICEEGLRDPKRATEHYRRIIEIAPGNKQALDALGRIYESTEQWTEFIDITRRQIRVTSDRNVKALLYFKCGSVMEAKFDKEEDAIRYYDAAIKTSPSCLPAVHGLRDLYRRRKDWKRVIQTLKLEVKLWQDDKERAGVYAQIGRIYQDNLSQPERALRYFENALSVDPECVPANKALFELYFDSGDWEEAQPLAQALAQKVVRDGDPQERSEFYRKCGIVSRMTGDPRSGAESLIVALEIKPTNLAALDALVDLAKAHPNAYEDFQGTFRELEKIYRRRDDAAPHLARVRVAQAVSLEREGDLEGAEKLYAEAIDRCPGDFAIVSALVDLHTDMRRWRHAVDAIHRFLVTEPPPDDDARLLALLRQAEIHADYEMDPFGAIAVLSEIIELRPDYQEAHYRLAQQQYILRRFDEARQSIDRVIELAAAPGVPLSAESLARYYYYRGRIIETSGDTRGATSQYRRAVEYDPGYAPPALALAKRSARAGDQQQAETLLINAAHAAMEQSGPGAAVPLQRGLARILLDSGDRPAAIEAYRGILNVVPDGSDDRVALAEIYAMQDVAKAASELKKVINRDIYHAPAYRMLASLYREQNENERAFRALSVMDMLGFAGDDDRRQTAELESKRPSPISRPMADELRAELLLTEAATEPFGAMFTACAREITALFAHSVAGENLAPIQSHGDNDVHRDLAAAVSLHGVEPDVYVGDQVPGEVIVMAYPRQLVIVERTLLDEASAARRYLFGWALEAVRGGYALLVNLGRRQRSELGSLLHALLLPGDERSVPTNEFVRNLPERAAEVVARYEGTAGEFDAEMWIDRMLAIGKRAGLVACNDFGAATRMIARINGEQPTSAEDIIALGAVMGGPDLVRFYLSDEYHKLRKLLCSPPAVPNS